MTPQQLTGLALLLLEFGHWLEDQRAGSLDVALVAATVDVISTARRELVEAGAR